MKDFIKKHYLGLALIIGLTIGNLVILKLSIQRHVEASKFYQEGAAALTAADSRQEDAARILATANFFSTGTDLVAPDLVRWTNEDDSSALFYCVKTTISDHSIYKSITNNWSIYVPGENDHKKLVQLPSHEDSGDEIYYHLYDVREYDGLDYVRIPALQSYQLLTIDGSLYEICREYRSIPQGYDIDSAISVGQYFSSHYHISEASISGLRYPAPKPGRSPVQEVDFDSSNIILIPEEKCCGCGDNCKCETK